MKDCRTPKKPRCAQRGFTLIELMITVAIIGILAAVAYPSYLSQVRKSARTSAKAQIMDLANREQQFLLANRSYTSDTTKLGYGAGGYTLPSDLTGRYVASDGGTTNWISVDNTTAPSFTVTFKATGKQVTDGDLSLTSSGTKAGNW
jgi:type IV pilus assembly protein PilE